MTSSIDDDQPATDKTRSKPDRATTEAALRSSDHTTIDYSRFDAIEEKEDVVIERRSWGPTRDKRTAPLRITLNARRFTLAGPWLRRSVCDLGRAYLKSQKIFRVFRLDGAAQTRVELGLLAEEFKVCRPMAVVRVACAALSTHSVQSYHNVSTPKSPPTRTDHTCRNLRGKLVRR